MTTRDTLLDVISPILKHDDIVNGIMPVQIVNFDDIYDDDELYTFAFYYTLHSQTSKIHNESIFCFFDIENIDNNNKFYVKLPMYLSPYKLEYFLEIDIYHTSNRNDKFIDFECIKSPDNMAMIPCIYVGKHYGTNDQITITHGGYDKTGTITKFDDDKAEIKCDKIGNIITKNVSLPTYFQQYIIDITDRTQAINKLILNTNNQSINTVYSSIHSAVCKQLRQEKQYFEIDKIEDKGHFIVSHVCLYLVKKDYNYMIDGIFLHGPLQLYYPCHYSKDKYICIICQSEISLYGYFFAKKYKPYDCAYCLSCIYSVVMQCEQLEPILMEILKEELNDNCIDEIVSFCVGKINKFDIKDRDQNEKEMNYLIDDNKEVGLKRCMSVDLNESRKRQRLK